MQCFALHKMARRSIKKLLIKYAFLAQVLQKCIMGFATGGTSMHNAVSMLMQASNQSLAQRHH